MLKKRLKAISKEIEHLETERDKLEERIGQAEGDTLIKCAKCGHEEKIRHVVLERHHEYVEPHG